MSIQYTVISEAETVASKILQSAGDGIFIMGIRRVVDREPCCGHEEASGSSFDRELPSNAIWQSIKHWVIDGSRPSQDHVDNIVDTIIDFRQETHRLKGEIQAYIPLEEPEE